MKQLILFLIVVLSLVSCKDETKLQPGVPRLKKIITYCSIHKNEIQGVTTFEYDVNGNLYKEINYERDTLSPKFYSLFEYENDKKTHEYTYTSTGKKFIQTQEHYFQYDNNLLIKEELKTPIDQKTIRCTEYQYDKSGNLLFKSIIQTDSLISWKEFFVLNSNNLKTKTIYLDENLNDSGFIEHYYQNNLLSNEKIYNSQNELCFEYNYLYDSDSNLIEKNKTINGETKMVESMSYLYSNLVEKTVYDWTYDNGYIYRFKYVQVFEYE